MGWRFTAELGRVSQRKNESLRWKFGLNIKWILEPDLQFVLTLHYGRSHDSYKSTAKYQGMKQKKTQLFY